MTLFESEIKKHQTANDRPAISIIIIASSILLPKNLVDRLLMSSGTVTQDTTVKIIINGFTVTS